MSCFVCALDFLNIKHRETLEIANISGQEPATRKERRNGNNTVCKLEIVHATDCTCLIGNARVDINH